MIEVELKSSYQNTKEMPKIDNSDTLKSIDRNMASKRQTPSISNKTNKNLKDEIDKSQIDPFIKNSSNLNEENFDNNNLEKKKLNKESKNKIKNPKFSSHQKSSKIVTPPKSSATYKIGSEKNPILSDIFFEPLLPGLVNQEPLVKCIQQCEKYF